MVSFMVLHEWVAAGNEVPSNVPRRRSAAGGRGCSIAWNRAHHTPTVQRNNADGHCEAPRRRNLVPTLGATRSLRPQRRVASALQHPTQQLDILGERAIAVD